MTKRILFALDSGQIAGSEISALKLIDTLNKEKFECCVLLPFPGDMAKALEKRGIAYWIITKRKGDPSTLRKFYRLLKKEQIVILHLFTTRIYALVAKCAGVKVIERVNMSRTFRLPCAGLLPGVDYIMSLFVDRIIAVSQAIRTQLIKRGVPSRKIDVVYNGIDTNTFISHEQPELVKKKLGLKPDAFIIGTVARLEPQKGLEYFIDAMSMLLAHKSNFQVIIAGRGPLAVKLKDHVQRLGLSDTIFFVGFRRDVADIIACMDIFVLPSLWEPLPNVLLESMALAKAVIATNVGGIPEIVIPGKTGLLVRPGDKQSLISACNRLLDDTELNKKIGIEAQKEIQQSFTQAKMTNRTEQIYRKMTKE